MVMAVVALLLVVLTGIITGIAVAIDPSLDLKVAGYFLTAEARAVIGPLYPETITLRECNRVFTAAFYLISVGVLAIK
jgi:hypothetical protein